jgi:hypothetical protein
MLDTGFLMLVFLITRAPYCCRVAEPVEAARTKIPNLGSSGARGLVCSMLASGRWMLDTGFLMLVFLITKATYRYREAEPVEATRTKIPHL